MRRTFFRRDALLRLGGGGGVSCTETVTVAPSPQFTVTVIGLPEPPPPTVSALALTEQAGGIPSTNEASADACGSTSWRVPSLLKSTNATIVSPPAFAPGSATTAEPVGPSVVAPSVAFGPVIV